MIPIETDCVNAIIVTTEHPMKWPISGINPQTRTIIATATGEGRPKTRDKASVNTDAIKAMTIWLPTKEPTREITALVKRSMRSRRLAGAKRTPIPTICGSEVMK